MGVRILLQPKNRAHGQISANDYTEYESAMDGDRINPVYYRKNELKNRYKKSEMSRWFTADTETPRAVVLLIHGLNQKPSKWRQLIFFLNSLDLHVYRLTLRGHGGAPFGNMISVTARSWQSDFMSGYGELDRRYPGAEKIFVAYSLGGLVALESQLKFGKSFFTKQVLLAPSLFLRPYVYLVKPVTKILPFIPSRTPKAYRANPKATASAAYQALFELLKGFHSRMAYRVLNSHTLVMMKPGDEVVSYNGIKTMMQRYRASRWALLRIPDSEDNLNPGFKHLVIDRPSLGKKGWEFVTREMKRFLDKPLHF